MIKHGTNEPRTDGNTAFHGFTLIELLVVVIAIIIAILLAAMPVCPC